VANQVVGRALLYRPAGSRVQRTGPGLRTVVIRNVFGDRGLLQTYSPLTEKVRIRLSARRKVGPAFAKAAVFLVSYALLISAATAREPITQLGQNVASIADYRHVLAQLDRACRDYDLEGAHLIAASGGEHVRLHHLASAATRSNQPAIWLGHQVEILEKAGTIVAACAAHEQASATLDALPERHRGTRATPDLEACLKGALLQLRR
jgi:hypothetical protein